MNPPPPHIAAFLKTHPECAPAVDFFEKFEPQDGVDYEWVEEYARERYKFFERVFNDLDAKAASLVNLIGGSTGFVTVGSVAAAASSQVGTWAAVAAIPAVVVAFVAFIQAVYARATHPVFYPPPTDRVTAIAARHPGGTSANKGRAELIPQWHLCTELMRPMVDKKAGLVESATWHFAVAVALLGIPLVVVLVQRLA